jgi:hypothetical protein
VERFVLTVNQMCLPALPGYAPRGTKDRAEQARLTLSELDAAIGAFVTRAYNLTPHSETGQAPQARWEAGGFLPQLPDSLEQLDLLLLTVAKSRKVHPDGIHYQSLRYLDPVLADYVGEPVTIRYDPRDLAEIRVYHRDGFLCRAVCSERLSRDVIRDGDEVTLRLGDPPTPVPKPFADLLLNYIDNRSNRTTATNPDSPLLFPGRRAGQPLHTTSLRLRLRNLDLPNLTARTAAIRQLVLEAPAPVVASMLGYHPATTETLAIQAGATWMRYAPGDHTRR